MNPFLETMPAESPEAVPGSAPASYAHCSHVGNSGFESLPSPSSSPFYAPSPELVQAFKSKSSSISGLCKPSVSVDTNPVAPGGASTSAPRLQPHLTVDLISPHLAEARNESMSLFSTLSTCISRVSTLDCSLAGAGGLGCPPHGVKSVCGKRAKMEDTFVVQVNFFDLPSGGADVEDLCDSLPARLQTSEGGASPSPETGSSPKPLSPLGRTLQSPICSSFNSNALNASNNSDNSDTLHFFGVYDGHGGAEAAQHCANRMHHLLFEALANVSSMLQADASNQREAPADWASCAPPSSKPSAKDEGAAGTAAITPTFSDSSRETCPPEQSVPVLSTISDCYDSYGLVSPSTSNGSSENQSVSSLLEEALRSAFLKTDAEFACDSTASTVGSTAVVALLGKRRMWVANCGDSRAVLCRGGRAIQLTDDHKPEREDEAERVEKAGGQVLFWNGHRVMGVLAMSRAIGDHGLRPYVIPEPEITVLQRTEDDDFMLLASDGLWDVMTNQEAIHLAKRCMARAREKGASAKAAVRVAASVLTSAAIDRGSKDNVTVVIVDLKAFKSGMAPVAAVHDGLAVELGSLSVPQEPAAAAAIATAAN